MTGILESVTTWECRVCGKRFEYSKRMERHLRKAHNIDDLNKGAKIV